MAAAGSARQHLVTLVVAAACLLYPAGASAQIREAAAATVVPPAPRLSGPGPVVTGALIGAGVGVVATALAASAYGENEGGRFCGRCFVEWGVVAVPVGAGVGAAVGALFRAVSHRPNLKRPAARYITGSPVFRRRGAGVVVTARF